MDKKMLLIIDPQNDFISGSLAVEGAKEKMDALVEFFKEEYKNYAVTVITADWHPANHCSFKENGGTWPSHCVQFTEGARIYNHLFKTIMPSGAFILNKGNLEDKEEYSIMDNENSSIELLKIIETLEINEIDVCGIAGDYCVLESVKGLRNKLSDIKINLLNKFVPFIGEPNLEEFEKCNVNFIE
jgi:nicotinamidase/pyrazinamidase